MMLEIPATNNNSEIGRDVHIYTLRMLRETTTGTGLITILKISGLSGFLSPVKLTLGSANQKKNLTKGALHLHSSGYRYFMYSFIK